MGKNFDLTTDSDFTSKLTWSTGRRSIHRASASLQETLQDLAILRDAEAADLLREPTFLEDIGTCDCCGVELTLFNSEGPTSICLCYKCSINLEENLRSKK